MTADRDRPEAGRRDALGGVDFVVAVRQHSAALHAYLARRAGTQTADDLLSDVWLRAFRSRHNLDPTWDSPRPWLYGIARNTLRAHWRLHARPDPPAEVSDDPWDQVDERLDAERIPSVSISQGRWLSSVLTTGRSSCWLRGNSSRQPR